MQVLLSARSWRGQPVYTTTLYKPTKCQIFLWSQNLVASLMGRHLQQLRDFILDHFVLSRPPPPSSDLKLLQS